MASAAPAYAASLCPVDTLSWASFGNGTKIANNSSTNVGHAIVTFTNTGQTTAADNATVTTAPNGSLTSTLCLFNVNASSSTQTATFTFDKMVTSVSFTVTDVDSATNTFNDRVQISPPGYTFVLGASVQGDGTSGNLFRPINNNTAVPSTSGAGNVTLSWANPLNQVSIVYSEDAGTVSGSPLIGISDISLRAQDC